VVKEVACVGFGFLPEWEGVHQRCHAMSGQSKTTVISRAARRCRDDKIASNQQADLSGNMRPVHFDLVSHFLDRRRVALVEN
jgi:hypothetical protein